MTKRYASTRSIAATMFVVVILLPLVPSTFFQDGSRATIHAMGDQEHTLFLPVIADDLSPSRLYRDAFNDPGSGWLIRDSGTTRWGYQQGEYEIALWQAYWFGAARAPILPPVDYELRVRLRQTSGTSAAAGVLFGQVDWTHYYVFAISPNLRSFSLWRTTGTERVYLGAWTTSAIIHPGNEWNHLLVQRSGEAILLSINDAPVGVVMDRALVGTLYVGLYVESMDSPQATFRFDDFELFGQGAVTDLGELPVYESLDASHEGPLAAPIETYKPVFSEGRDE